MTQAMTSTAGARTTAPVVAASRVTKVFKDFWMRDRARAVEDVSFEIHPHEIFGLLGPNGSGKSTTIKMILGLLKPTKGRLMVFGKPPSDVETKRRIGYLPEESYLYPFLNARETLDYYAKLFKLDRRVRLKRIDELLEMVGLVHAQHRPVSDYSKGMQRRIGLAQALINDPDFLILDEPTTGLDPIGTRQVKDLIIELGRRGKTVLLSSHLLPDVEDVADRLTILYGGKIRGEGTVGELLETTDRTTLTTDTLDDATVAEIDEVIRRRSSGAGGIQSVTRPRQRLEELFLGIVERAQAERLATSGAENAGATAAFLRGDDEGPSGEELIESLVTAEPAADPEAESLEAKAADLLDEADGRPDAAIIEDLVEDEPAPAADEHEGSNEDELPTVASDAEHASPRPSPPADIDDSVISSLLGDEPDDDKDGKR